MNAKISARDKSQGTITASLGKDLIAAMDEHCGQNDLTRSQLVRAAVIDILKRAGADLKGVSLTPPSRKGKGGRASLRDLDPAQLVPTYGQIIVGAKAISVGHNSDVEIGGSRIAIAKPKTKKERKKNG